MTNEGRLVFGWFIIIILMVSVITGLYGVYNSSSKKERRVNGLMLFSSTMTLILLFNIL